MSTKIQDLPDEIEEYEEEEINTNASKKIIKYSDDDSWKSHVSLILIFILLSNEHVQKTLRNIVQQIPYGFIIQGLAIFFLYKYSKTIILV